MMSYINNYIYNINRSIETLGEAILNLTGQIDLPITLETSHYLFMIILLTFMEVHRGYNDPVFMILSDLGKQYCL